MHNGIGFVWKFYALGLASFAAAAALCGCGGDKSEKTLFPVSQGSSWTYAGTSGKLPFEMLVTVTSAKQQGNKTIAVLQWSELAKYAPENGSKSNTAAAPEASNKWQPIKDETYEASPSGVTHTRSGPYSANRIEPPLPVLELPLTIGKKWSWQGRVIIPGQADSIGNADSQVVAREKVTVPAGTFDVYRIQTTLWTTVGKKKLAAPSTVWFAPGVGLVKQNSEENPATGEAPVEAALTKYTIR